MATTLRPSSYAEIPIVDLKILASIWFLLESITFAYLVPIAAVPLYKSSQARRPPRMLLLQY
jgi:hypothetical protein